MNNEREFQRYQEFLAYKANRISGDLGKVALAPFTLGIAEVPTMSASYEAKEVNSAPIMEPTRQMELGALSLRQVMLKENTSTPKQAIEHLSKEAFDLAA